MEYQNNGRPLLTSVEMRDVVQTLYVYEHFHMTNTPIPDGPVNLAEQKTKFVIDEVYERMLWSYNYLEERW